MKIAFNPSTVAALTSPPDNKDITFDLRGRNIFARGVKFYGTDTNTWRDIKINNVSIGSHTLDLRNGSNTTLSNTNGVVTINSTWRPVVDNLTSDSTTSSLSAKQGKVLKALIDGKSNSDHNHDGRYVRKSGDTMSGVLTIDTTNFGALTIKRNDDVNGASIQFRGKSNIYGYIGFNAANRNKQLLRWNGASSQIYTILDTSSTYISGGKGVINGTTITQVDNADKLDGYHANTSQSPFGRVPTIGGDGVMEIGKYIDFHYDNEGKYDYSTRLQATGNHQNTLLLPSGTGTLALTSQIPNKNSWNYDDRYLKLTGGAMVGTINRRSGGSTISGRDHAIIRQTYAPGGSSWNPIACVDTETGTWTLGHLSSGSSNTDFSFCFSTNADYNAGNNNGNYVTLRNRVGTIALTSEIPSKGSWNYDDRYYTKAESNAKYITDITTSVNKLTFTKNGSSIARTITVNNVQSLGKRSPLTERNAISGIYTYGTYSATDNLAPTNYFETLGFGEGAAGTIEIGGSWVSGDNLYWRALRDCCEDWFSWKTILDSSNYSSILDSRYYTESEVNSLLSKKLDRVNLSVSTWNPRGYNLAADYHYNGGDLSISENSGKMYVSIDGYFWQNEGQYRVLDISDVAGLKSDLTIHQYLSATDATWWPLIWGGNAHNNTSDSTGAVYKSHDKLSWQTSSQTLYATKLRTTNLDTQTALFHPGNDSTLKIYSGKTQDAVSDGHIGLQTSIDNTDGQTHGYPTQYGSRCVLALQPRGGSVYIGNMPNGGNGRKLNVNGDIGLFNTGSIRDLSIGGGIYWNPNVESATDSTDAASITLVKSGVRGGTTLVLSQMNDTNDTIQFQTNGSARLYHNSYPILTTQNTYVSNNKGYINGTEITQVNNADKVDNRHAISTIPNTGIIYKAAIYTSSSLTSYWVRLASIPSINQNNEFVATIHVQSGHSNPGRSAILLVYLRGAASSLSKSFKICCNSNYDPNRFRLYYKDSDKTSEIWYQTTGQCDGIITTVISQSSEGSLYEGLTLYSGSITAVQTPSMSTYLSAQVSTITDNISGNASTATKLATPRKIWGQSFDGTADVDNTLRIRQTTGNYCEGIRIQTGDGKWATIILGATADSGTNANAWSIHRKPDNNFAISRNSADGANGLVMTPTGMGLGTTAPTQRLDVAGNIRTTGNLYISHATNNNMTHDTSNPRIVFSESGSQAVGLVYTDQDSYRASKGLKVMDVDNSDPGNVWFEVQGYNYSSGYVKNGSNDNYVLLGGGGHKAESSLRVAYASSAGNAQTLGGFPKNYGQAPFGTIPCIGGDGVMEIGRYIDYHYDNSGKYDFSTRLQTTGNYANEVNLPSASGTLALISQVLTWKSQIIDMRSYSESYWHPVTVPLPNFGYNKIKVSVQLNSGDKPSWATHNSGITCNMEIWATASGWGTTDSDTICLNYTYKFCSQNPCGWMQLGSPSLGVVFLRGGSRYTVYTDFDATFTPHNQKYTWSSNGSSQDTGGPYTSCPGLNFNMGAIRADLIATMVQARRVCAGHDPGIDNSISCSNWFRSSGNTGWYNTTYQGGWYMSDTSWIRAHNSVGIYTGGQIYSGSSIRMGNILLEHTDEINNITNGGINLNYRNSGNISLCQGGGNVGIGTMSPTYKLDVNGQMRTSGFHHSSVNSDNYILLAGGGYKSFGGDDSNPIFLGYLNLDHGNDGTISSSFSCLGYSVPFTYTRGGNYCRIYIHDTTHQVFYIKAATASVNYSGGGMNTWTGVHRGSGAWWLHCYAEGTNEVRVKGFCQNNNNNDSWWGGNPLWSGNDGVNRITVCIFGYVKFR